MQKEHRIIDYKILYTIIIILIYLVGKCIPLYRVDTSKYVTPMLNAELLIMQTIGGDLNKISIFALGISPYMMASLLVQIVSMCRKSDSRSKDSPKMMNRIILLLTFIFSGVQAFLQTNQIHVKETFEPLLIVKVIIIFEMITGAMLIMWLCERNKKYGIGGQTIIIYINILSGIITTLFGHKLFEFIITLIISLVLLIITLTMEHAQKQIPLQRISIHNIYADKNYLAIKLNPIGVMPVMFSAGFFMIPQLCAAGLKMLFPQNHTIIWIQDNMTMTKPLGIVIYIGMLYLLTIGFSMIFISPKDTTEQFLKSGDSIVNLHAGRETRKYLSREIRRISFFSATVMSICIGTPMILQNNGIVSSSLVMIPTSIMMLTGMWYNLYQEIITIKGYDAYKSFI